jgi:TPR repeat protein
MYANGEGVPEDDATAVMWYTKAAEQGHAIAQFNLGFMYANGDGVPEDNISAYMWLNLAAALGHENAKKGKEIVAERMTREDISKAQALSRECLAQDYKNCGY